LNFIWTQKSDDSFFVYYDLQGTPNGLRHRPRRGYLRWGGDGEAVQPACLACTLPQAQVDDSPGKNDKA